MQNTFSVQISFLFITIDSLSSFEKLRKTKINEIFEKQKDHYSFVIEFTDIDIIPWTKFYPIQRPNPFFSVYKRKNSILWADDSLFFFNRKTSNKKPVNRMPRLLPCNTLTIFKYRKNISRIACIFRETMCVCMYVYDGITRRKVRCVSRSIEEAIYPSEISILARLASITLVGGAISCDPRSYKSDTRTPPLRYIYIYIGAY